MAEMIGRHCPSLSLAGATDNLAEAVPLIEKIKPSLLLLDIEFPPGTVFSILEKLLFRDFQVVFFTAYNSYATQAFRHNAVDYILKPVTKEALLEAVKKVEAKIEERSILDINMLAKVLKSQWDHSGKIALPSAEGILFLDEKDIIHCEASGRYTIIHFDEKKLTITKTLKEIEALLNPADFFRIHHSHVINLKKIIKYHRGNGGTVELVNGRNINVSSSRKDELLDILMNRNNHWLQ
jgi:two-component system LytT family response regulator